MPVRAFNMFRLLKPGSPMSIGSWALVGFGLFALASLILVLAEGRVEPARAQGLRRIRQAVAVPGALVGFFIASYTGVLLGATNRPVWGGNAWIGPLFLTSAASTGVAAIALWPARARLTVLRRLDLIATALEALLLVVFLQSLGAGRCGLPDGLHGSALLGRGGGGRDRVAIPDSSHRQGGAGIGTGHRGPASHRGLRPPLPDPVGRANVRR